MPINKSGLGESQVLTRLRSRSSRGFMFKSNSPFKPSLEQYTAERNALKEKRAAARAEGRERTVPAAADAAPKSRPNSDAELYGYDPFGNIDYLGPPLQNAADARMEADDEGLAADDEGEAAADPDIEPPSQAREPEPSSPPPSPPPRRNSDHEAHDVDAVDYPISPGSREVIHVHNVKLRPEMISDVRLLEADGCYNDDLVDLFFTETAIAKRTVAFSVNLVIKLSEKDDDGGHRHEPAALVHLAGKKKLFEKGGLVSFPISVCTVAERTTDASGGVTARIQNDFHYSTALYSVDDVAIYHADSLDFRSHKWAVEHELAAWIEAVGDKQGRKVTKPAYTKVSCPQQGATMHCGPASVMNNRIMIGIKKSPVMRSSRMTINYPQEKFMQNRKALKTELFNLIESSRPSPPG